MLIVDRSSQRIGTRRTAWGLGSNFGETRNCFRPDFFISLLSSYMERKINNEKGKLFKAECFKNPKTVFFSVVLMLKWLFTFSCIFMMANPSKVASSGFFSKGSSETGNIENFFWKMFCRGHLVIFAYLHNNQIVSKIPFCPNLKGHKWTSLFVDFEWTLHAEHM